MRPISERLHRLAAQQQGMSLVEVLIAISLIGILSTAVVGLYFSSINSAATQQRRQVAITIANQSLETVSAWSIAKNPSTGLSNVFKGRAQSDVIAQFATAAAAGVAGVSKTGAFWDTSAVAGSAGDVVLSRPALVNGTSYTVQTLIGVCFQARTGGDCVAPTTSYPYAVPAGKTPLYRVIVIVKWMAGSGCLASGCSYVAQTLLDPNTDLLWNTNG